MFGHLAPETQLQIMEFCSPGDLYSLSWAHSSLRDAAERALYSHIYFRASPFDLMQDQAWNGALKQDKSLLHTLASNKQKAAMAKELYIEFERVEWHRSVETLQRILLKLSEALRNMPNLVDLRVVYDKMTVDPSFGSFSRTIRGGYFKLHTLFLAYTHDLARIMVDQPQLQLMGIYFDNETRLTKFMKQLFHTMRASRRRTLPTVFTIDCSTSWLTTLDIFPSTHRLGNAREVCRDIITSLSRCPKSYYRQDPCILAFDLLGITRQNINLFHEAADAMAIYMKHGPFLAITIHDLTQKPWETLPNFTESLTRFKEVQIFTIYVPQTKEEDLQPFLQHIATSLVEKLRQAWPKLTLVMVQDYVLQMTVYFEDRTNWQPETQGTLASDDEEDEGEGEDDEDIVEP